MSDKKIIHKKSVSDLKKIASRLLASIQLSDCKEDYGFKVPVSMLKIIKKQNEELRHAAILIIDIANDLEKGVDDE